MQCFFNGEVVGVLSGDTLPAAGQPTRFMPYRSLAHLRLTEALARSSGAEIELEGPVGRSRWLVSAMTPESITLAPMPASQVAPPAGAVLSQTVQASPVTRTAGMPGALAGFVAAFAPADLAGGQCQTYPMPNGATTLVVLTVAGDDAHARMVSIELDGAGRPLHFSDVRGNININGSGPRTSVTLDFVKGTAQASNEADGKFEIALGTLSSALEAEHLGPPQRALDELRKRCVPR